MLVLHKLWGSTCCPGCTAVAAYERFVRYRAHKLLVIMDTLTAQNRMPPAANCQQRHKTMAKNAQDTAYDARSSYGTLTGNGIMPMLSSLISSLRAPALQKHDYFSAYADRYSPRRNAVVLQQTTAIRVGGSMAHISESKTKGYISAPTVARPQTPSIGFVQGLLG